MKISVPLTGTHVTPEGAGPQPGDTPTPAPPQETPAQTQAQTQPTGRPSLHRARLPRPPQPVEGQDFKWEWNKFGKAVMVPAAQDTAQADDTADVGDSTVDAGGDVQGGDFSVPPQDTQVPPPTAQTFDGLQQQIQNLTQTVNILAQAQLRGMQPEPAKPQAPQAPDPSQVEWDDPTQVAEYHRLNNSYVQALVQHQVNAALEPHAGALQDAGLNAQYNAVVFQHGRDEAFQPTMQAALKLVAAFPGISIPDAYRHMASNQVSSSPQSAAPKAGVKPAQRTITAQEAAQKAEQAKRLPASNGVSGAGRQTLPSHITGLGAIMAWNRQNGRAN